MKSWFHTRQLRRQRSEATLHTQKSGSLGVGGQEKETNLAVTQSRTPKAESLQPSNRMSIERYLKAPLEDEPASVPAIKAALRRQLPQERGNQYQGRHRRNHSQGTSYDANSEGRQTFYTSASGADSTGTSLSAMSRSKHNHTRNKAHTRVPDLPKLNTTALHHVTIHSPDELATGRTNDSERTLAEFPEVISSGEGFDQTYRAKIEAELALIQQKARKLEEQMRRFEEEQENAELLVPRITDEMAYERMAAKPKLAWILGGDSADARSISRPKSSGSIIANSPDDVPDRPSTSGTLFEEPRSESLRRAKSSSALDDESRQVATNRNVVMIQRSSSKRAKFFCTFCRKKFHNRAEWIGHEKNIHMPEELWVCCPRTGELPKRCPFCAKTNPSPSHLADHNYGTCQNKPLSERTFDRKDYFLQHIAQEHRVSPGQKPIRLTELSESWRHPLPLKKGHQALHCGFCGSTFSTYKERTEHVTGHFMSGVDMMSWWSARLSHEVTPSSKSPSASRNVPYKCRYCKRVYENLEAAGKLHPVCDMWSCSFLPGMQYTIYPSGQRPNLEAVCCYCNESLTKGNGKVKGAVLKEHISTHSFRTCNQRLYFSAQRFRQHLQDHHKTNYDGTLFAGWTLLMKSSKQTKLAEFEAVVASSDSLRRINTDPVSTPPARRGSKKRPQETVEMPKMNFMDFSETPQTSSAPRKKIRRKPSTQTMPEISERDVRDATRFFTRAATIDNIAEAETRKRGQEQGGYSIASAAVDGVSTGLTFYRKRLDASMRNKLYVRDEKEGPLSTKTQRLFRKVPGSIFGGLVLHSSLVGVTPARMTNSVDIYALH